MKLPDVVVMLDDAPLKVIPVDVKFHAPELVIADAPSVKLLVAEPVEVKLPTVSVFPFVSKAPFVRVKEAVVLILRASCRVQPPPTPLKFILFGHVMPFVVIVWPVAVAEKFIAPRYVRDIAE